MWGKPVTTAENNIEQDLISKLEGLKYSYRPDIRDRATLERNFREKFEALNRVSLTESEFARLMDEIVTPDVFTASRTLRERNSFIRDDGTPLNYTLVNIKDWCKNTFEVVNQLRINTDYSHHRYDVILLINGVPTVQIELKTLGINPRRAMEQIVEYKNDPGNGYTKTLLCFLQLFIVSNRDRTFYFANNNTRHFAFNAEERFLPVYEFADVDNKKITHLDSFAETFLIKCTLGQTISRYMVLFASEQKLLMMRPYQIYDLNNADLVLLFAYNRTGKTRLSMEFKDAGKRKTKTEDNPAGIADTLYFNAYTEDLFIWENDLDGDSVRHLQLNEKSKFFTALTELALDETIAGYLSRYADFDFDIDYTAWKVSFRKGAEENIKISRGEQNIFIWCLFMAICERMLDGHISYQSKKYLYIDDPISSLDDYNAISVACDLAKLLRRAATRKDGNGTATPIKIIFSSHHALFFNVMCNELGRRVDDAPKVTHKRYFLHRPNAAGVYTLQATDDTPFFHHVATLAELQRAADPNTGKLYTFHFNALRSIMEKTASFFGHTSMSFCLKALNNEEDRALFNRALNLLSHGAYAIHEPTEMGDDNKALFRRILSDFIAKFEFAVPEIVQAPAAALPEPAIEEVPNP